MKLNVIGNRYRQFVFVAILLFATVILTIISVVMTVNANKGYAETTATIAEIVPLDVDGADAEEGIQYIVYVDYVVDGVSYTHKEINSYDSSYAVGKEIVIMYDPADPETIVAKNPVWLIILLYAGAGLCFAGTIAAIVYNVRVVKKAQSIKKNPAIMAKDRKLGEAKKMYFSWDTKTHVKLRYIIEDEKRNLLYEGKMTKHSLVGAHTYLFTDYVNNKEEEHKVGHVNEAESGSWTVSRGFTFDGVEMTEYLDANRIKIRYGAGQKGIAISFDIFYEDKLIAKAETSSRYVHEDEEKEHAIASKFRLNQYFYQIEGQESYVDVIFLALFKEANAPRAGSLL